MSRKKRTTPDHPILHLRLAWAISSLKETIKQIDCFQHDLKRLKLLPVPELIEARSTASRTKETLERVDKNFDEYVTKDPQT